MKKCGDLAHDLFMVSSISWSVLGSWYSKVSGGLSGKGGIKVSNVTVCVWVLQICHLPDGFTFVSTIQYFWSRLFNCSLADNVLIFSFGAASFWWTIWEGVLGWWDHPCMCKTAKHLDPIQKTSDARVNKNHLWLSHKNRCLLLPSQVQIQCLLGSMLSLEITMAKKQITFKEKMLTILKDSAHGTGFLVYRKVERFPAGNSVEKLLTW